MQEILVMSGPDWKTSTPPDTEIRPSHLAPIEPAPPGMPGGYPSQYVNSLHNSRVTAPVLPDRWAVRWRYALGTTYPAGFIYQVGNRILVHASDWRLLDSDSNPIANGSASGALAFLDAVHNTFYTVLPSGFLSAARLDNGHEIYEFLLTFGSDFGQTLLARVGDRLLFGSYERQLDPHGSYQAHRSLIEVTEVAEPVRTTSLGLLLSDRDLGKMLLPSRQFAAAADEKSIVSAVPNRVYISDWNMNLVRVLKSNFEPVTLSLDESGRISLVIRDDRGFSLWLLTQSGQLGYALRLPDNFPEPVMPPLIGFDHTVYLLSGGQILSISAEGKLKWRKDTEGAVRGGLVTSSGELLLSEGGALTAWNSEGQRRVLYSFPGEELQTPPVLTSMGEILAATREKLYCLTRGRSSPRE